MDDKTPHLPGCPCECKVKRDNAEAAMLDEMVARAAKAVARERGEDSDSIKWAMAHRPPWWKVAEQESTAALTAAGVPELLALVERLRAQLATAERERDEAQAAAKRRRQQANDHN